MPPTETNSRIYSAGDFHEMFPASDPKPHLHQNIYSFHAMNQGWYQGYSNPVMPNFTQQTTQPSTMQMPPSMPPVFPAIPTMPSFPTPSFGFGENYGTPYSPTVNRQECKDYRPLKEDKTVRNTKYEEVSGRLCLLSGSKKYLVTVGELCRRIEQPETLHTSLLNGILRNAKAKDNGQKLRSALQHYDIDLVQGRRKTCKTTGFTAFTEAEARQLAFDFSSLCKERGGADELGSGYADEQLAADVDEAEVLRGAECVEKFLDFILSKHVAETEPDDMDHSNLAEKSVHTLSLFTHGFSHVALNGVAQYFKQMVTGVRMNIHRRQDHSHIGPMDPMSPQSLSGFSFPPANQ